MQPITLDQLPPEVLALLEATRSGAGQRSPVRQPLTDLRTPQNPRERINRPSFFFEMGERPEPYVYKPYPALRYKLVNGKVEERRVDHAGEDEPLKADGWLTAPPYVAPKTVEQQQAESMSALQAELDSMSPEDRAWVLEAQAQARRQALMAKMAGLSETDLAAVAGDPPKKRGPGRPKAHGDGA